MKPVTQKELDDLVELIDQTVKEPAKRAKLHKVVEWIRYLITGGAMVPQGGFGGLETDRVAKKELSIKKVAVRLPIFLATSFCAAEGKRQLVMLFNKDDFHKIADLERKDLHPRKWTRFGFVNGAFTITASDNFGYLAKLSCDQVVVLLLDYNLRATKWAANIIATSYFQIPFVTFATAANLVGFPSIHRNAWNMVKGFKNYCLERRKYREFIDKLERQAAGVRREFRDAIKADVKTCSAHPLVRQLISIHFDGELTSEQFKALSIEQKIKLISAIDPKKLATALFMREFNKDYSKKETLIQTYSHKTINRESWYEFLPKHALGSYLTYVGVRGFYNFDDIGKGAAERRHIPKPFRPVFGAMVYISMIALALVSIYALSAIISFLAGRDPAPIFITKLTLALCLAYTILVVGIGGTPNTEQSWIAGEQSTADLLYAFVSSALCEFNGMFINISLFFLLRALVKDENKQLAKAVDDKFTAAIGEIRDMDLDELEELTVEEVPKQYPEWAYSKLVFFGPKKPDAERGPLLASVRGTSKVTSGLSIRGSSRRDINDDDATSRIYGDDPERGRGGKGEEDGDDSKKVKMCLMQ